MHKILSLTTAYLTAFFVVFSSCPALTFSADAENEYDNELVTFIVETDCTPVSEVKAASVNQSIPFAAYQEERAEKNTTAQNEKIISSLENKLDYVDTSESVIYTQLISGFTITARRGDSDKIAAEYGVVNVFEDFYIEVVPDDEEIPETPAVTDENGINQNTTEYQGQGTAIAVIDSGFRITHKYFSQAPENPKYSEDYIIGKTAELNRGKYYSEKIPYIYDYYQKSSEDADVANNSNHGTHVAGIAAGKNGTLSDDTLINGSAPEAQLVLMACGTSQTSISTASAMSAMNDAAALGVDAINMSFGGPYVDARSYTTMQKAITNAKSIGIVVCVAAGNEAKGAPGVSPLMTYGSLPPASMPDYGASGLYGNSYDVISVASADRSTSVPSAFSSWGVTPGLELTPTVMSYGGDVRSSTADGGYGYKSGTSMASPNMAGAAVCIKSYLNSQESPFGVLTGFDIADTINHLLCSTAEPIADSTAKVMAYYSPRHEGAGLINVTKAITTPVLVHSTDNKPALNLGELSDNTFTLNFIVHNYSNTDITFDKISVTASTDGVATVTDYDNYFANGTLSLPISSYTDTPVSVAANDTAEVCVNVTLKDTVHTVLSPYFTNGYFVEGFIKLENSDYSIGMPYMGFRGSWGKIPIFDKFMYEEGGSYLVNGDDLYGTYLSTTENDKTYALGVSPVDNSTIDTDYMILSPANTDKYRDSFSLNIAMLRNSHGLKMELLDDNKKTVNSQILASNTSAAGYLEKYTGMTYNIKSDFISGLADGEYTLRLSGWQDNKGVKTEQQKDLPAPIIIDNTAPLISSMINSDCTALTVNAEDAHYLRKIEVNYIDNSGNPRVLTKDFDCTQNSVTETFSLTDADPASITITAADYAYNSNIIPALSIVLTSASVKATGFGDGILMVSGYDENECLKKLQIIDGWQAELTGFENCKTIKAFVWNSVDNMKPLFDTSII